MGQMCSSVPQSLLTLRPEVTEVAARLSTSFFIETFIHAKEKVIVFLLSSNKFRSLVLLYMFKIPSLVRKNIIGIIFFI
jgi:hypothetical protein